MLSYVAVGVILVLVIGAAIFLRARRSKTNPADLRGPAAEDEVVEPSGKEARGRSASRWLSSLVKASGDDRAKRDGHRY